MIDTKTLTCANCHSGNFTRFGDNEFKCTHCGSITLVEDDVAKRLEKILSKLQVPASTADIHASMDRIAASAWIVVVIVILAVAIPVAISVFGGTSSHSHDPKPVAKSRRSEPRRAVPPPLDPGLVKVSDLHAVDDGKKIVGLVHNNSDRVVSRVGVTLRVHEGDLRKSNKRGTMTDRLLPGDVLPIEFRPWSPGTNERFDVLEKSVSTDDDFHGRVQLDLARQQLVHQGDRLRFIGQLANNDEVAAKSIRVRVTLFDADGKLTGYGYGSPESSELARGDVTNFDVSIDRFANSGIASMQYLIDSDRVETGGSR